MLAFWSASELVGTNRNKIVLTSTCQPLVILGRGSSLFTGAAIACHGEAHFVDDPGNTIDKPDHVNSTTAQLRR